MNNEQVMTCGSCGGTTFVSGRVSNGYAKVMPLGMTLSTGSALIYTFCKECGEVSSIKVKDPGKF